LVGSRLILRPEKAGPGECPKKRGFPRKLELRQRKNKLQYKTICRSLPITIIL
jgi:hypothetical protein